MGERNSDFTSGSFLVWRSGSGAFPGATRAISDWRPAHERGLALDLLNTGGSHTDIVRRNEMVGSVGALASSVFVSVLLRLNERRKNYFYVGDDPKGCRHGWLGFGSNDIFC